MTARFSETILHAVTEIKRRKVTREVRKSFLKTLSETSHAITKIYSDSLAKMSPSIKIWITEKGTNCTSNGKYEKWS